MSKAINAGKYNRRISIYSTEVIKDAAGFQSVVRTLVLQPYAAVKTTRGFTLIRNSTDFEKAYTNFTIRFPHVAINRDMVIDFNGKTYSIEYLNNVDEANVESHGMGYGEESLAHDVNYQHAHLERMKRMVQRDFNHPSVIIWSMGNEAGHGINFMKGYEMIKSMDQSRPVHYERADGGPGTDIACPMYFDYESCEKYASRDPRPAKPLIQCEYAHAMGNSIGGLDTYWELIRKYPSYQGGFIWDFVDQGLRDKNKEGKEIFTYGGDYGRYPASDNNFNCNGIIAPDRRYNPHAYEVRYNYQNIWATAKNLKKGQVEVYNENFFTDLADYYLAWTLLEEGKEVANGRVDNLAVPAQGKKLVTLKGFKFPAANGKEYMLNVEFRLKEAQPLLAKDYMVAHEQFQLTEYAYPTVEAIAAAEGVPVSEDVHVACLILKGGDLTVTWNRSNGWIEYIDVNDTPMMEKGFALKPNFWRAPTDNDRNIKQRWLNLDVWQGENLYPVIQETHGLLEDGKIHIGDNDLLKIHLLNSAVKMSTERGRGRLVKVAPSVHIDGCAALLDAMCVRQKWYGEIGEQLKN